MAPIEAPLDLLSEYFLAIFDLQIPSIIPT